jgi:purine nucleoside phosphorylase
MSKIAIIGGSGFENPSILKKSREIVVDTPYGKPSSTFKTGLIEGNQCCSFIPSRGEIIPSRPRR